MTAATMKIERSGPAIRAALAQFAQVARARAGDFTGLLARDARGDWVRL